MDYKKHLEYLVRDVRKKNLDIGDFQYIVDNKLKIIIERKTIKDLCDSIKDGRLREQKVRLNAHQCLNKNIIYLIEGKINSKDFSKKINGIPITTIYGSMVNILVRDNMLIYRTGNLEETIFYILDIVYYILDLIYF